MKLQVLLCIGLSLFSLSFAADKGTVKISVPSNAENVKKEKEVQKINYEPDKGHLALLYNLALRDDYYWPVPFSGYPPMMNGYGYGYGYPRTLNTPYAYRNNGYYPYNYPYYSYGGPYMYNTGAYHPRRHGGYNYGAPYHF